MARDFADKSAARQWVWDRLAIEQRYPYRLESLKSDVFIRHNQPRVARDIGGESCGEAAQTYAERAYHSQHCSCLGSSNLAAADFDPGSFPMRRGSNPLARCQSVETR